VVQNGRQPPQVVFRRMLPGRGISGSSARWRRPGGRIREERRRRHMTMRDVAEAAGLSDSAVQAVESGRVASLDTYLLLATALGLQPNFEFLDPRRREPARRKEDPVHAAMGETQAAGF